MHFTCTADITPTYMAWYGNCLYFTFATPQVCSQHVHSTETFWFLILLELPPSMSSACKFSKDILYSIIQIIKKILQCRMRTVFHACTILFPQIPHPKFCFPNILPFILQQFNLNYASLGYNECHMRECQDTCKVKPPAAFCLSTRPITLS